MKVQLDAELVMELRADCPEEDRLVVGGNDWGFLKVIQIKGGYFDGEKLRGRVVPGGADWNMGVGGDTEEAFILELYLLNISFRRMTVFTLQSKT